jgi:UDP-N-acetylglucosamine--N-acetylmuramyl-(pentapeptide) pyrophosphoryl-undecaprenol N-acetylglucosamine transferase
MPDCLAAADLVICRAGALSLAEVTVSGLPSILIPYPLAAYDHQYYNAKLLSDRGAAVVRREEEVDVDEIIALIDDLRRAPDKLESMAEEAKKLGLPDAAEKIVSDIEKDWKEDGGL